jgi:hypothetical protein
MAQHDYTIANASGLTVRTDINNVLQAIATVNSDNTEPSTMYAGMLWHDTGNNVIKIRNQANTAWFQLPIATDAHNSTPSNFTVDGDLTVENISCAGINQQVGNTAILRDAVVLGDLLMTGEITKTDPCVFVAVMNPITLTDSDWLDITYDHEQFDKGNDLNTSTGYFTAPTDGIYRFDAVVRYDWSTTWLAGDRAGLIMKKSTNGGTSFGATHLATGAITLILSDGQLVNNTLTLGGSIELDAGDMIKLQAITYSTGDKDILGSDADRFEGRLIQAI